MKYILLSLIIISSISCHSQGQKTKEQSGQIGQYVVDVFEDSNGNLWFGTLEKGVAKYDGKTLKYFTSEDGLSTNRITTIIEDSANTLWFGTGEGITKYDGNTFTNYTEEDGLCDNRVSGLFIDSKGMFWIGTWGGICQFDGKKFTDFALPYPHVETPINKDTKNWITEIKEDSQGNMWFCRDGYGATKYDGQSFTHFTKKMGLHSNNVTVIEEDKAGNLWFATRVAERDDPDPARRFGSGGINKFDGKNFTSFPEIAGFNEDDVYGMYRDPSDNLWVSTSSNGLYQYDGKEFINYNITISLMSMLKDKNGTLWLGGAGGLFRMNSEGEIINVLQDGPWQ